METGERLAAYLSGDLDAGERTALEADLAGDPAMRARLERIRRADATLAELPDEELPEGFEGRLHRAVAGELDTALGHDELAARRARRSVPGWLPTVAAAALVVVVGGGVVLTGGMGGEDSDEAATLGGTAEDSLEGGADVDADGGRGQDQAATAESAAAPVGPRVVAADRTLDDQALAQLAADPLVLEALGGRSVGDPAATARAYAEALGVPPSQYDAPEVEDEDDAGRDTAGAEQGASTPDATDLTVVSEGRLADEDLADVARCLPVLQDEAVAPIVPLYAELGTNDDTPVIAYAALAPDGQGDYRRVEVWLVERESCSLMHFVQHDR